MEKSEIYGKIQLTTQVTPWSVSEIGGPSYSNGNSVVEDFERPKINIGEEEQEVVHLLEERRGWLLNIKHQWIFEIELT